MLTGHDLLSQLDSDLLEYGNDLAPACQKVNAWRALCNLHERLTLLALHADRGAARNPSVSPHFQEVHTALAAIEARLRPALKATKPDAGILNQTLVPKAIAPPVDAAVAGAFARIERDFIANGGRLDLDPGDAAFDPILRGFHAGEAGGRWTGPFTTSAILLPLQKLRAIGANTIRLAFQPVDNQTPATSKFMLGLDLIEDPSVIRATKTEAIFDLRACDHDADRIVLNCKRTRTIGADPRFLGLLLSKIVLEHTHVTA